MDNLNLKKIEEGKITCAKKLFNDISSSKVKYRYVDSYKHLLSIMNSVD